MMKNIKLPCGINKTREVVYIDNAKNGIECECICPACKSPLVAKNGGQKREHHFAHLNIVECEHGYQSALHYMAKDLFLLDDLFDFDRKFYTFVRPEKDMMPYTVINKENQTILIHNVVGINKEDLKISTKTENGEKILYISGQTKDKISGNNYEINSRFKIKAQSIRNIECECANGLLYVTISYDKPEEEEIKIK